MSAFLPLTQPLYRTRAPQIIVFAILLLFVRPTECTADTEKSSPFSWQKVSEGYHFGRYQLNSENNLLTAEVLLLKFSLKKYVLSLTNSNDEAKLLDAKTVALNEKAVAVINAHFFDTQHHPLGILIKNGSTLAKLHRGGRLLTGVFNIKSDMPAIDGRTKFSADGVSLAIQAGPRIISAGRKVSFSNGSKSSRRSGIAITKDKEVIVYATPLRFPGASFTQIQDMLSNPVLKVQDALNLDGGSSSQLFIRKNTLIPEDIFVTGGQRVPVVLVVKERI
jgi:uncharacterized protein YigE (DUF2233 family)